MNQKTTLYQTVYNNMNMKETGELVSIWVKNDRSEWTNEAFEIIRDILVERLGDVPLQGTDTPSSTRRSKSVVKEKGKIPLEEILVFSPMIVAMIMLLLGFIFQPNFVEEWLVNLFFLFLALGVFVPGLYFGWMSWFQGEQTKQRIIRYLPKNKKALGSFYHIYTLFLPDRYVPTYFLYILRFGSLSFLYTGMRMFLHLLEPF